jgi:hypothetical protein
MLVGGTVTVSVSLERRTNSGEIDRSLLIINNSLTEEYAKGVKGNAEDS